MTIAFAQVVVDGSAGFILLRATPEILSLVQGIRPGGIPHAWLSHDDSQRCRRMKILDYVHLRNIYRSTGVGRVSRELTEHMARTPGVELRILADRRDYEEIIPKVGAPWDGYQYSFFERDTSRQQAIWYLADAPKAESYWPEAEIVYCTAESYVPVTRARLAVACHDMQLFEPAAHPMSRWLLQQRLKWQLLFRRLGQTAHMIHTISAFSAERIAHFFPALRDRIRVVHNAASQNFFLPPTEEGKRVLAQLGIGHMPYVLLPGGLHFRKNAELVLATWPEIQRLQPELQLVITSHNTPAYAERAKQLRNVIFSGFQEEDALVALYHGATLVWFPSKYEGFGMPVVEAMACGAPVVCSTSSALPEIAGGAAAAMVSPDRPKDHIEAILGLLPSEAERKRAGQAGRLRAEQFTWARSAERLLEAFAELL